MPASPKFRAKASSFILKDLCTLTHCISTGVIVHLLLCLFDYSLFLPPHCKFSKNKNQVWFCSPWCTVLIYKCLTYITMATHSSTLAWKIPWVEEPGGLQSMRSLGADTTEWLHFHFSLSCIGEGNGNPFQCSCLENPRDGGAWWAAVHGVAQSQTRLERLSSSSSNIY